MNRQKQSPTDSSAKQSDDQGPMKGQVADLADLIAKRQVVTIVGSGVSIASTGNAPTASWQGLLLQGITHCEQFIPGFSKRRADRQREALKDALEDGDLVELLAVAEQLSTRLGAPKGGEFVRWLRESLSPEHLPLKDDR